MIPLLLDYDMLKEANSVISNVAQTLIKIKQIKKERASRIKNNACSPCTVYGFISFNLNS
jgi:hypothetical protein